jgi:hypothetical protein
MEDHQSELARPQAAGRDPTAEHTYICNICGETVDRRDLGRLMLHERPAHRSRRVDRDLELAMERRVSLKS